MAVSLKMWFTFYIYRSYCLTYGIDTSGGGSTCHLFKEAFDDLVTSPNANYDLYSKLEA